MLIELDLDLERKLWGPPSTSDYIQCNEFGKWGRIIQGVFIRWVWWKVVGFGAVWWKKNHVVACALSWRTCPKLEATPFSYLHMALSQFFWRPSMKLSLWSPPTSICILCYPYWPPTLIHNYTQYIYIYNPPTMPFLPTRVLLIHRQSWQASVGWRYCLIVKTQIMGLSQFSLIQPFDSKANIQSNDDKCNSNGSLWNKVLEARAKRMCQGTKLRKMTRKNKHMMRRRRNVLMKRPARLRRLGGSRRRANGIERRVRTLKRLVPNSNSDSDSVGLDGLFRETADYILSLQLRVRLMQIMVKVFSSTTSDQEWLILHLCNYKTHADFYSIFPFLFYFIFVILFFAFDS